MTATLECPATESADPTHGPCAFVRVRYGLTSKPIAEQPCPNPALPGGLCAEHEVGARALERRFLDPETDPLDETDVEAWEEVNAYLLERSCALPGDPEHDHAACLDGAMSAIITGRSE